LTGGAIWWWSSSAVSTKAAAISSAAGLPGLAISGTFIAGLYGGKRIHDRVFPPTPLVKSRRLDGTFLNKGDACPPGTLTPDELEELQKIADEFGTIIEVVGSRAEGRGRNIDTSLPIGKGEGTRSDIDVRIDSEIDILTGGALSDGLKNILGGGLVDVRTRLPGGSRDPRIIITPR
jgi:hypothetical protein